MDIVFVHGRSQQLKDPEKLHTSWQSALESGLGGSELPDGIRTVFPYYGNVLATREREYSAQRRRPFQEIGDYERFVGQFVNELLIEYQPANSEVPEYNELMRRVDRGPLNWGWVQKGLEFFDNKFPKFGDWSISKFTRDVFVYLTVPEVREEIDGIVRQALPTGDAVVVSHSLGTVVAYSVLSDVNGAKVPLFVTLGSPLGVRTVVTLLGKNRKLEFPVGITSWLNAYDTRDVVALLPINDSDFPGGTVENFSKIKNETKNRHGISGYLGSSEVAKRIVKVRRD